MKVFDDLVPSDKSCGNIQGVVTWASLCSGSEGNHFVMHEMQDAFNERDLTGSGDLAGEVLFEQVYACKIDNQKRKWIDFVVTTERRARGKAPICIFTDIKNMKNKGAYCHVHEKECVIPYAMVVVVSTSCKDLSGLGPYNS